MPAEGGTGSRASYCQDGVSIEKFPTLYRVDGVRYDRVSKVLDIINKPNIIAWMKEKGLDEAQRILEEAGRIGTAVHAMCEEVFHGRDPWSSVEGTELEPYYTAFVPWYEEHVGQVIFVERTLWSDEYGFCGTVDEVAELRNMGINGIPDGSLAVLDIKTSRWNSWTYRLQTAFYKIAIEEKDLLPSVETRGVVHLSTRKPGTVKFHHHPFHDKDENRALAALELYRGQLEYEDDWRR